MRCVWSGEVCVWCGEVWCGGTGPQQASLPLSVWAGVVRCDVVGPVHNRPVYLCQCGQV